MKQITAFMIMLALSMFAAVPGTAQTHDSYDLAMTMEIHKNQNTEMKQNHPAHESGDSRYPECKCMELESGKVIIGDAQDCFCDIANHSQDGCTDEYVTLALSMGKDYLPPTGNNPTDNMVGKDSYTSKPVVLTGLTLDMDSIRGLELTFEMSLEYQVKELQSLVQQQGSRIEQLEKDLAELKKPKVKAFNTH
ncbi:MAG: hypothetical protein OEX08_01780 [Candidatus Nomurabacteria bacterium]|nr:hypothetical protein [Candidatus Nomurabacteria bacterium]